MKLITLSHGRFSLVDDIDFDILSQWKWSARQNPPNRGHDIWYAVRTTGTPPRVTIYMHRQIASLMGIPASCDIDHKDRNGLNNQRYNLRPCSQFQNNGNRRKQAGCSSRFKGVSWNPKRKKWEASIKSGKNIFLGRFLSEIEAANAYDVAAKEHFGEFARLNLTPTCTP